VPGPTAIPEVAPLLAALLALPTGDRYPPLTLSPQRQKERTLEALVDQFVERSRQQPVVCLFEDAHWSDPTSLELLDLLVYRVPALRVLVVITARPEFVSRWGGYAHVTTHTLNRLTRREGAALVAAVTGGKALPPAVLEQIVAKTDGVPLFAEELTKMVLESHLLVDQGDHYALAGALPPLAIPATLQDALLARLDRLATVKEVAQVGAVLGREFAYKLLAAVSLPRDEALQEALDQLVHAGLLFRRGTPPEASYRFKHALVQDAAYASLLKRTRQQLHQHIAQVLEARFPETAEFQPELLAHHYTEAGLTEQAIPYWHRAGQQALQRSTNLEAVQHLTRGLALLATLPDSSTRAQQELDLQMTLGPALIATRGWGAPEVEQTYVRARALCQQVGETPQLFPTLLGLCAFYRSRGAFSIVRELGEQLDRLVQRAATPLHRLAAHDTLGMTLYYLGDYATARAHLEQGIALTDPTTQRALALHSGVAPGITCLAFAANTLWCLGYPAQAVWRSQEALALAKVLAHPYSLVFAQHWAASLHYRRREVLAVQTQADALLTMATAQGFPTYTGYGICWQGWVLAMQGQGEAGIAQMRQGLAAFMATGQELSQPLHLVLLAEAAGYAGQVAEGLRLLAEALAAFEASERGDLLAEAYRLQGVFLLRQTVSEAAQAEACFQQALSIARRQQAKSWELRAAMSLSRLWQQQGKRAEAHELLAPIYDWFTEGFDTPDLQEAKTLLEELVGSY
jgi:predicted ATPase